MSDDLDAKLARISSRLAAQAGERQRQADDVRRRLETVPDLLAVAELTRSRFAARLTYARVGTWETGSRREFDATAPRPPDPEPIKAYHWRLSR